MVHELQSLQHKDSVVLAHGLSSPRHVESSWTRNPAHVPCIGSEFSSTVPPGNLKISSIFKVTFIEF